MRLSNEYSSSLRMRLDQKVSKLSPLIKEFEQSGGWLRSVRDSLGMTTRLLESRFGIASGSVIRAEKRECEGTISLDTLNAFAKAMDCQLIYAIVPKDGIRDLESLLEKRAERLAMDILNEVVQSMESEGAAIDPDALRLEKGNLKESFVRKLDPRLWDE